jgi:hypothetical protein
MKSLSQKLRDYEQTNQARSDLMSQRQREKEQLVNYIDGLQERNARLVEHQNTHVGSLESAMSNLQSEKASAIAKAEGVQNLYEEAQSHIEVLKFQLDDDKAFSSKQQEEIELKLTQSDNKAESL